MKKVFLVFSFLLTFFSSYAGVNIADVKNSLIGEWQIENVVYTFTDDSLCIDEIDIEGDIYEYSVITNDKDELYIKTIGVFGDKTVFKIEMVTDVRLRLYLVQTDLIEDLSEDDRLIVLTKKH